MVFAFHKNKYHHNIVPFTPSIEMRRCQMIKKSEFMFCCMHSWLFAILILLPSSPIWIILVHFICIQMSLFSKLNLFTFVANDLHMNQSVCKYAWAFGCYCFFFLCIVTLCFVLCHRSKNKQSPHSFDETRKKRTYSDIVAKSCQSLFVCVISIFRHFVTTHN